MSANHFDRADPRNLPSFGATGVEDDFEQRMARADRLAEYADRDFTQDGPVPCGTQRTDAVAAPAPELHTVPMDGPRAPLPPEPTDGHTRRPVLCTPAPAPAGASLFPDDDPGHDEFHPRIAVELVRSSVTRGSVEPWLGREVVRSHAECDRLRLQRDRARAGLVVLAVAYLTRRAKEKP